MCISACAHSMARWLLLIAYGDRHPIRDLRRMFRLGYLVRGDVGEQQFQIWRVHKDVTFV